MRSIKFAVPSAIGSVFEVYSVLWIASRFLTSVTGTQYAELSQQGQEEGKRPSHTFRVRSSERAAGVLRSSALLYAPGAVLGSHNTLDKAATMQLARQSASCCGRGLVARTRPFTSARPARVFTPAIHALKQDDEQRNQPSAPSSSQGQGLEAAMLTAFSLLTVAQPAAADTLANPFSQSVTANSLYVTLALFLMSVPGESRGCAAQNRLRSAQTLRAPNTGLYRPLLAFSAQLRQPHRQRRAPLHLRTQSSRQPGGTAQRRKHRGPSRCAQASGVKSSVHPKPTRSARRTRWQAQPLRAQCH